MQGGWRYWGWLKNAWESLRLDQLWKFLRASRSWRSMKKVGFDNQKRDKCIVFDIYIFLSDVDWVDSKFNLTYLIKSQMFFLKKTKEFVSWNGRKFFFLVFSLKRWNNIRENKF